jgi:hypothetical protein
MEFCSQEPEPPRLVRFRVESHYGPTLEIRRGRGWGGPYELHIAGKLVGGGETDNFRLYDFLPIIRSFDPRLKGRPNQKGEQARRIASTLTSELRATLRGMRAVGAFRASPERRYDYQGRLRDAPDLSGRGVVHALIDDTMRRGRQRGHLFNSVNRWLKSVGRVRLLPVRRISPTARLYEVRLKDIDSGRWANFADVGFGIGQALPVLVEGLRTPENGLFLVQEPEIHLHPDAQLAMADYLVGLANSGRNVIAETHSEAVLLRVRKAVVEAQQQPHRRRALRADRVSILYVASGADGTSHVTPLQIGQLGQVHGWPEGFMEEVTRERLDLLKTMAHKTKE